MVRVIIRIDMKTLYVDIDEDLSDLLAKIEVLNVKQILLVIPKDASLFKNLVNLKILKRKSDDWQKDIQVFSNDEKAHQMLKKAKLKIYYGHLKKRGSIKPTRLKKLSNKSYNTSHQKKVSITEVSKKTRKDKSKALLSYPQKKKQRREQKEWACFFLLNTLKKKTIILFTLISIVFFVLVLYIAVPSATIYLTPDSNVIDATINITFANEKLHPRLFLNPSSRTIPLFPLDFTLEKNILYKTTGKVFTGISSRCNLKIINDRTTPWTLIPKTRFREDTGLIFRIDQEIEVPAARFQTVKDEKGDISKKKVPGTLIVSVQADEFDEGERIIGARGNLVAGTHFNLPGLSEFNQKLISAVNEQACRGGVTSYYSVVTADDVKASEKKIRDELKISAKQYLIDAVEGENIKRTGKSEYNNYTASLKLFDNPQAIQYKILETGLPPRILGRKADEFSITGKIRVKGIAYEQERYYEILEQGLLSRIPPHKILSRIDFDSSTYHIVYSDSLLDDLSKVKVSVTVRGLEEYNFDPRSDQGEKIVSSIMEYVPGRGKLDASYFISNLEEIQKSHISIWPFWKNNLPERRSSITIKVQ